MGFLVTGSALLKCTFGAAPSALMVLPTNFVMVNMPAANIMDHIPLLNIMPFGTCTSVANPMVAAAMAIPPFTLKPMPCIPMTMAPWVVGKPTILIGNMPALSNDSKLMCMWGGCIGVNFAGQAVVQL
ncbi:MAG: DUF4280 domain-containing protein [Methylococcales bacterium]|nr:MAG: DUF4280 domain-containing protein [Methylococcales bacterium]